MGRFFLSVEMSVHLSVCPFICSLLRYCLNVFLPPLPEVGCPKILEMRNPWGKINRRKLSPISKLLLMKGVKSPQTKKFVFGWILPYWAGSFWYRFYYSYRLRDSLSKNDILLKFLVHRKFNKIRSQGAGDKRYFKCQDAMVGLFVWALMQIDEFLINIYCMAHIWF